MNLNTPHQRSNPTPLLLLAALLVALTHGCIVDSLIGTLAGKDHNIPPPPNPTSVNGTMEGQAGATLNSFGPTRDERPDLVSSVDQDDAYTISLEGTETINSLTAVSTGGAVVNMVIVPNIPAATSVYEPGLVVDMATQYPLMNPGDPVTTAVVLLIDGKLRLEGGSLSDLDPSAVESLIEQFTTAIEDGESDFVNFMDMVTTLLDAASEETTPPVPVFLGPDLSPVPNAVTDIASSLNQGFLDAVSVDYTGDDTPDTDTQAFETAIEEAVGEVDVDVCLDPDLVRVVWQVNFNYDDTILDGNCSPRNPALWLSSQPPGGTPQTINPEFSMYFVGGTNEFAITCADQPDYPFCATQQDIDLTNEAMDAETGSGWIPNVTQMYDDGTNGDAVGGDGIWTLVLDLPRGIRMGYKYTWSQGGVNWTGTEEWPGNGRLLEALDVNGDGVVVRYDSWGDEATNKDRQNLRSPARGGRGNVVWTCSGAGTIASHEGAPESGPYFCAAEENGEGVTGVINANLDEELDAFDQGYFDFREIPVDLDGDCQLDGFPSPGPVTPITSAPPSCYEPPDGFEP